MQYNYYSLYNITEARASDKHYARIEKASDDQSFATGLANLRANIDREEHYRAKKAVLPTEAAEHLKDARVSAAKAEKSREKLLNIDLQKDRLRTHIRDRKREQNEEPVLTDRQLRIRKKVAENKARLKSEAKKKAAQHKTKIQQHGRKQKVGAVLAAGGLAGAGALLKSAHDDVTG